MDFLVVSIALILGLVLAYSFNRIVNKYDSKEKHNS